MRVYVCGYERTKRRKEEIIKKKKKSLEKNRLHILRSVQTAMAAVATTALYRSGIDTTATATPVPVSHADESHDWLVPIAITLKKRDSVFVIKYDTYVYIYIYKYRMCLSFCV